MKRCVGCGDEWPDSARVCYTCGYRFQELGFAKGWKSPDGARPERPPKAPAWMSAVKAAGSDKARTALSASAFGLALAGALACLAIFSDSWTLEGLAYAEATYALAAGLLLMKAVDYGYGIAEYRRSLANFGGLAEFVYRRTLVRSVRDSVIYLALAAACLIALPVLGADHGFVDVPAGTALAVTALPAILSAYHLAWLAYVVSVKHKGGLSAASKSITRAFDATRDYGVIAKVLRVFRREAGPAPDRKDEVAWQFEKYAYLGTAALAVVLAVRQAYVAEEGWAWREAVFIASMLAVAIRLEHLLFRHREASETPFSERKKSLRPLMASSFKRAVPGAVSVVVIAIFGSVGDAFADAGSPEGPALSISLLAFFSLLLVLEGLWMLDLYLLMRPAPARRAKVRIEDVFLVDHAGNLLTHHAKNVRADMDDDIMMGMFTAIQDFMRETFRGQSDDKAQLNTLHYGDFKILIEHGEHAYIAMVIKGEETPELRNALKASVGNLHRKFGKILGGWNGKADELAGINDEIKRLIQEQSA